MPSNRSWIYSALACLAIGLWAGFLLYQRRDLDWRQNINEYVGLALCTFVVISSARVGLVRRKLARLQKQAARKILDKQRAIYGGLHEYRLVSLEDFPQLNQDFYQRMTVWFELNGFAFAGDLQNVTVSAVAQNRTVLRTFIGDGGTVIAAVYHFRSVVNGKSRELLAIDFDSEFSDGTFIATTNSAAGEVVFEGIETYSLTAHSSPDQVLRVHRALLSQAAHERSGIEATVCQNIDDVIQIQHRMQSLKARQKQARGYFGAEDFQALRRRPLTANEQTIVQEIERLKRTESDK